MKKTLRTILAGSVAFLAVSCYDDSYVLSELEKHGERLDAIEATLNAEVNGINDLAARLAAAEGAITTLNGNVTTFTTQITGILTRLDAIDGAADGKIKNLEDAIAALQAADETFASKTDLAAAAAKIAVVKVEEKEGNIVLTLADGSTVSLSKPLANVENSGLVTVVADEDGNKYWAVVEADGTKTSLDVPVGHPDVTIAFSVAENGDLMYAVNGGEALQTGVNTGDLAGCHLAGAEVAENGKSVTLTIDGVEYVLPVYNPVPTVQIKAGKQFFKNGQAKTVEVGIENVNNLAVMNQPYGWKASVKGSKLTVTAPSEANTDAETSGVVVLHGDANGQCMTAALNVAVGAGMELTIDANGLITVVNPLVVTSTNWMGDTMTTFGNAAIGVMSVDAFNSFSSMQELYTAVQNDYYGTYGASAYLENIKYNLELGSEYDPENYIVDTLSFTIAEFGSCTWPSLEPVKGEKYVVWAIPQDSESALYDDAIFAYYEPVLVEPQETITYNEISLTLSLYGTDMVYAGMVPVSMFEDEMAAEQWPNGFDSYMELGYGQGGPWKQFSQYGFEAIGQPVANGGTVSVAELNYGALLPGTKYYVWLMPKKGAKAPAEYDYATDFKPYVFEYTTANIVAGGAEAGLALSDKTDYSSITVDVTVPEGTAATAKFYEVGEVDEFASELDLVKDVLEYGSEVEGGVAKKTYLSDGQTMTLVVVTVDADGKYAIAQDAFSTLSYPIVETITVSVDSITKGEGKNYTAVVSVTGATKVAIYSNYSSSYSNYNKYLAQESTYMKYGDVVDGKATVAFTASSDNYYILVSAYNENEDGTVKEFCKYVPVQISTKLPATK